MSYMAKKTTITVRIDPELKDWMNQHTLEKRRGLSGFVEEACNEKRKRTVKKHG